jgi:hypothetical protein
VKNFGLFDNYFVLCFSASKVKNLIHLINIRLEKYEKKNGVRLPKAYKSSNRCDSYALVIRIIAVVVS